MYIIYIYIILYIFRKLWFSASFAIYVWIKSKLLDTGLWNFYHLFFVILLIFLGTESNLAKKITKKFFIYILGYFYLFILFVTFFQSCYLIFHSRKVATYCKEQNKKESWQLVKKQKSYSKSKNSKFLVSKYIKVLGFRKQTQNLSR